MNEIVYDTAIVGGGLAGLTLSIKLAVGGRSVILFEKEQYPFHKVCGEYISMECWDYLHTLGLPLKNMSLPLINKLVITSPSGNILHTKLPLGGFGISRYKIDNDLKNIAIEKGVTILENCRADDIVFEKEIFVIKTNAGSFKSRVCCGCYGKRSNMDVKWKRNFITRKNNKLNNYIGVKYHVETNSDAETISLHNFKDGYCGISKIEDNRYCLCYLTNAENLKKCGSIEKMEQTVLSANPFLKDLLENTRKIYQPVTISQISFNIKSQVENHVLMAGDSAGMITPLCGNGMSMAIHAGKIAAGYISDFLDSKISRDELEVCYSEQWESLFGKRLRTGRIIQYFFGKVWLSDFFINTMKQFPGLTKKTISLTHGKPF